MSVYVWVGLGFFLSLLTSSYDAMNMFFHGKAGNSVNGCVSASSSPQCSGCVVHGLSAIVWIYTALSWGINLTVLVCSTRQDPSYN